MRVALGIATVWAATALAQKPANLTIENRVRLEYDDNIYLDAEDSEGSFRIGDELSLSGDARFENAFLSLRYRVGTTWYDDRDGEELDWTHALDFVWNQTFSPRLTLGVLDTFLYADQPETIGPDGQISRTDASYYYNSLNATLATMVNPKLRADLSGRSQVLRYDDEFRSAVDDYDIATAGLTVRQQLGATTTVFGDARFEQLEYPNAGDTVTVSLPGTAEQTTDTVPDRGSDVWSVGLGLDRIFAPTVVGTLRAGYTAKELTAANSDSETAPYGEGSLTLAPVPTTRFTLGAAYSLYQSTISSYANQTRTAVSVRAGHDLTAKVTVSLGVELVNSEYEAADTVDVVNEQTAEDGSETAFVVSARASYAVNRMNSIEAGASFSDLSSDLRDDYQRNIYDVSWRVRL